MFLLIAAKYRANPASNHVVLLPTQYRHSIESLALKEEGFSVGGLT
jgi:hypothetical protein